MGMNKSKIVRFLTGKGFYIALAVCLVGAGATAWVAVDRSISNLNNQNPDDYVSGVSESSSRPISEEVGQNTLDLPRESRPESSVSSESEGSQASSSQAESSVADSNGQHTQLNLSYVFPLDGDIINPYSSGELVKSLTLNDWRTHDGIDIKAKAATPVAAVAEGVVANIYDDPMYGTTIEIEHPDGLVSVYQSLNQTTNVTVGQSVAGGDIIGSVGETAIAEVSLETHLHFAMMRDGDFVDPLAEMGMLDS